MKTKSFLNVILILYCIAGLALFANAADKNLTIKDVEYLKGDDFVQLHFKIAKMLPIPDVFYPDKNNNKRIIMRISNVRFQLGKNLLTFDSSVIDSVKVDSGSAYTDVEIQLKEQVNYRVFTNRKGLYIEFPNVKNVRTVHAAKRGKKKKQPPAVKQVKPGKTINPPPLTQANKRKTTPQVPKLPPKDPALNQAQKQTNRGRAVIKDIFVSSKSPDSVTFDIILSRPADFYVIPIPNNPARLAIDLNNTHSKQIKRIIDLLNVKKIRGAYNTASKFRLVFDLHYLKHYKVSPRLGKPNVLEVAFFNKKYEPGPKHHLSVNKKNKKKRQKQGMIASAANPPTQSLSKPGPVINKKANKQRLKNRKNNKKARAKPAANDDVADGFVVSRNESGVKISDVRSQKTGSGIEHTRPATKKKTPAKPIKAPPGETNSTANRANISEDFFGDEKSEVALQAQETPPAASSPQNRLGSLDQTIRPGERKYTGEPMGFNFHNADLKDVIKIIAKISGLNIVMDPGISGRVTAQLSNVPWDQALDLFLKINGLDMAQEGNILRIGKVGKLAQESVQRRILKEAQQFEADLVLFTKTLSFAKVSDVSGILKNQLSMRGEIVVDDRTNTLIISEIPQKIDELKKLIQVLDAPNPQVSIEARIVETNTNFIESFGIQWGYNFIANASHGNQTTLKFPNSVGASGNQFLSDASPLLGPLGGYAVNLPATGATSGTVFTLGNVANTLRLDMALSAMQTKGEGRIISAPKTTTQNNMEASIMQGRQIPVQTVQNNTITVVYRPAALELKVTPQITADGTVVTKLELKNNSADFGNLVNGIPPITTQSIQTTVMVKDGGTIVIGGMYQVEKTTTKNGVPFLSKIPILGNLFRSNTKRSEQKELLIFITPRIIK
jgi:type IV pilus assembly protein PilQ